MLPGPNPPFSHVFVEVSDAVRGLSAAMLGVCDRRASFEGARCVRARDDARRARGPKVGSRRSGVISGGLRWIARVLLILFGVGVGGFKFRFAMDLLEGERWGGGRQYGWMVQIRVVVRNRRCTYYGRRRSNNSNGRRRREVVVYF
ncbi:hypothetical protein K505DRAFT_46230 [Melanomma pulvis-pyrius CBS 109.77]|uniref:Uncharacterized protein n=1 Tax=Melanomma pulvis-pyrius CBS 109.77 TaxID=1314802 RepID=A0A6A6XAN3_9PLEO|nr:hypothetical protein K505DRAFT_46230 [Melanomma pulvis-pyrius CBS 109.77]